MTDVIFSKIMLFIMFITIYSLHISFPSLLYICIWMGTPENWDLTSIANLIFNYSNKRKFTTIDWSYKNRKQLISIILFNFMGSDSTYFCTPLTIWLKIPLFTKLMGRQRRRRILYSLYFSFFFVLIFLDSFFS